MIELLRLLSPFSKLALMSVSSLILRSFSSSIFPTSGIPISPSWFLPYHIFAITVPVLLNSFLCTDSFITYIHLILFIKTFLWNILNIYKYGENKITSPCVHQLQHYQFIAQSFLHLYPSTCPHQKYFESNLSHHIIASITFSVYVSEWQGFFRILFF